MTTAAAVPPLTVQDPAERAGRDVDQMILEVRDPRRRGAVRVRWRLTTRHTTPWRWRCSRCGEQPTARCEHAAAAAAYVAEKYVGIPSSTRSHSDAR